MNVPAALPRGEGLSGRLLAVLTILAAGLVAAFVAAPRVLAGGDFGGRADLVEALRGSFVASWNSGAADPAPDLQRVVDYWLRYHLAKAAIAAILLAVLIALAVRVLTAFARTGGSTAKGSTARGVLLCGSGALALTLAAGSLLAVVANLQGAAAPYASLLPMVTDGANGAPLTGVLDQIRQQLTTAQNTGAATSPALETMIDDFVRYHAAMVAIAAVTAAILLAAAALLGRRYARTARPERRTRRVLAAGAALTGLLGIVFVVVAVANTTVATDPVPALLAFFEGGL
ncbi:hypothetical protein [Actinocorallia longicatena]|uniref:Tat (Twin-arginine translocation) pathway signal sequence n=1 Tax=Actinocorallia longicatena TaxID=111803 RepID=A0ABP6QC48_9ACTN